MGELVSGTQSARSRAYKCWLGVLAYQGPGKESFARWGCYCERKVVAGITGVIYARDGRMRSREVMGRTEEEEVSCVSLCLCCGA